MERENYRRESEQSLHKAAGVGDSQSHANKRFIVFQGGPGAIPKCTTHIAL
jgi:hypothetical protein